MDPWSVPAHGRAPVQQALVDCIRIKQPPGFLPTSTFRSEFLRLKAEADAAGHPSGKVWIDRKCREFIRLRYGQRCYMCNQTIDLHLDVEPISRKLDEDDKTPANHGSEVFHKLCWKHYKHEKTNKRRRTKYEEKQGGGEPAINTPKKRPANAISTPNKRRSKSAPVCHLRHLEGLCTLAAVSFPRWRGNISDGGAIAAVTSGVILAVKGP